MSHFDSEEREEARRKQELAQEDRNALAKRSKEPVEIKGEEFRLKDVFNTATPTGRDINLLTRGLAPIMALGTGSTGGLPILLLAGTALSEKITITAAMAALPMAAAAAVLSLGLAALTVAPGIAATLLTSEESKIQFVQEMQIVTSEYPSMKPYLSLVQDHFASIHPGKPVPQTAREFVDALRDKQVYDEVYKAAYANKQIPMVGALQSFAKLEIERTHLATAESSKTPRQEHDFTPAMAAPQ